MDKLVGFARKKRLGDLLVDAGVISQDQLVKALQVQKTEKQGERLGVVLIDLGFTDEKQIVEALKAQLKIQSVDLSTLRIPEEIIRLLDEAVLRKYNLIPFKFNEKNPNLLCVAMSDPLDIRAMDDVSIITGCQVERFAATPSDIAAAIDRYYGNAEALRVAEQYTREKQEQAKARAALDPGSGNDENNVQQAPIVKLLGQYTNRYLWHVDEKLPGRKEKRKSVVSGWLQTGDSDKGCGNSVGCVRGTAVVSHRN